jgi:hypothetical protein
MNLLCRHETKESSSVASVTPADRGQDRLGSVPTGCEILKYRNSPLYEYSHDRLSKQPLRMYRTGPGCSLQVVQRFCEMGETALDAAKGQGGAGGGGAAWRGEQKK